MVRLYGSNDGVNWILLKQENLSSTNWTDTSNGTGTQVASFYGTGIVSNYINDSYLYLAIRTDGKFENNIPAYIIKVKPDSLTLVTQ